MVVIRLLRGGEASEQRQFSLSILFHRALPAMRPCNALNRVEFCGRGDVLLTRIRSVTAERILARKGNSYEHDFRYDSSRS